MCSFLMMRIEYIRNNLSRIISKGANKYKYPQIYSYGDAGMDMKIHIHLDMGIDMDLFGAVYGYDIRTKSGYGYGYLDCRKLYPSFEVIHFYAH